MASKSIYAHGFRTLRPLEVSVYAYLNTAAILDPDDYEMNYDAVLPEGESFTVVEVSARHRDHVLCSVDRKVELQNAMLPPHCRSSVLWGRLRRLLSCPKYDWWIVVAVKDIHQHCNMLIRKNR